MPCLLWAASERALGSSQLQVVASARDEQLQKTAQEKEELRLQHSCLTWIDAGSTSQSRYFLKFVAWLWFLQDKGFDESTEKARAGWQDAV